MPISVLTVALGCLHPEKFLMSSKNQLLGDGEDMFIMYNFSDLKANNLSENSSSLTYSSASPRTTSIK